MQDKLVKRKRSSLAATPVMEGVGCQWAQRIAPFEALGAGQRGVGAVRLRLTAPYADSFTLTPGRGPPALRSVGNLAQESPGQRGDCVKIDGVQDVLHRKPQFCIAAQS